MPDSRPNWLWRNAPLLTVVAGVLLFIGGEALDRRWQASLRQARCTVVFAKTEGQIQAYSRNRGQVRARFVEKTSVEFQVDGVGPRRTVRQVHDGRDFQVGQVRDCWVAGEAMFLYPEVERLKRRASTIVWSAMLGLWSLVWLLRRSGSARQAGRG